MPHELTQKLALDRDRICETLQIGKEIEAFRKWFTINNKNWIINTNNVQIRKTQKVYSAKPRLTAGLDRNCALWVTAI